MNNLIIRRFDADLQKLASNFNCGNLYLDNFLRSQQALNDNIGKTFVFVSQLRDHIIGYYNLGVGYIEMYQNGIYEKLGGSIHINNFALDQKYRGYEIGHIANNENMFLSDILLRHCFYTIESIRKQYLGFAFVTLSSTQEGYNLYKRNGFEELDEDMHFSIFESDKQCIPMYLALDIEDEI